MTAPQNIRDYLRKIDEKAESGQATEHSYRPALITLLEGMGENVSTLNEPRWRECGAPDICVSIKEQTQGWVETKRPGNDLKKTANTQQLQRYLAALPNLILTDYKKLHWFSHGELKDEVNLAQDADGSGFKRLMNQFLAQEPPSCGSAEELAEALAGRARLLCGAIEKAVRREKDGEPLRQQMAEMGRLLLPKLDGEKFADLMAQTITYGLFMARYHHEGKEKFSHKTASYDIPPTSPFLRDSFSHMAGPNVSPQIRWAIENISLLLAQSDMHSIFEAFGVRGMRRDVVFHFYEHFLAAYDAEQRERLGVYYTPEPVVSYIVNSVDTILREDFNLKDGLADRSQLKGGGHRVLILDPAAGSGTFLWHVIQAIRASLSEKGEGGAWQDYVRRHLFPRLFGFELQMAPYVVCHLKLGSELKQLGFNLEGDDRLGVYLTNTLEPPPAQKTFKEPGFGYQVAHEGEAASEVKMKKPVMVILGNPPYSGSSQNMGKEAKKLIEPYKYVDGGHFKEKKHWLHDDYVKFIAFAQQKISKTGEGVLAYITNHAWLDNPTFRGMRRSLMKDFDKIYVLDLHGNSKRKEIAPDGGRDENVFDIQQGVAISLFIRKRGDHEREAKIFHADLWGERGKVGGKSGKYGALGDADIETTEWKQLKPDKPFYFFVPRKGKFREEYKAWTPIQEVMPINVTGIVTARDRLTIQFTRDEMEAVVKDFADLPLEEARANYHLPKDGRNWKVEDAQKDLRDHLKSKGGHIVPVVYRPFDTRFTYYTGRTSGFISWPRPKVMRHMLAGDNLGLITVRQISQKDSGWSHVGITEKIIESCVISNKTREISYFFPLYLSPNDKNCSANLKPSFCRALAQQIKLNYVEKGQGDLQKTFNPEQVLHYIYAILHSPTYRQRYAEFLKSDFPRIPLPASVKTFRGLVEMGAQITKLHLLKGVSPAATMTRFNQLDSIFVEKVLYTSPSEKNKPRVVINKDQYFDNVPPEVWNFRIGGYYPAQKWLKDRKGRTLTSDDISHYRNICAALAATLDRMDEIDKIINAAGGWPNAFKQGETT